MNGYDLQVISAIHKYHSKHGEYPLFIEATPKFLSHLSQTVFAVQQLINEDSPVHRIGKPQYKTVRVMVIEIKE